VALSLAELERPCPRCGHQNAVHVGGAQRFGWGIYVPIWANATGWCTTPGCPCQGRTLTTTTTTEKADPDHDHDHHDHDPGGALARG
jgi:hypothetical protein